jgi:hypothetical protein
MNMGVVMNAGSVLPYYLRIQFIHRYATQLLHHIQRDLIVFHQLVVEYNIYEPRSAAAGELLNCGFITGVDVPQMMVAPVSFLIRVRIVLTLFAYSAGKVT